MGKHKPHIDTFLKPVIEELKMLSDIGVETKRGTIKVHCILCPVDSPARADLQKISYPGGHFSCSWCFRKAKSMDKGSGTTRVFKHKRLKKLRDSKNYLRFAKIRFVDAVAHHKGVKGISTLTQVPLFDIINGFQIEYMHAFCIGIFNQYLEALLGTSYSSKPWSLRSKAERADKLVLEVTPPHEITRLPEPLTAFKGMKASLKKSMFCYFLIPVLKALDTPQEILNKHLHVNFQF